MRSSVGICSKNMLENTAEVLAENKGVPPAPRLAVPNCRWRTRAAHAAALTLSLCLKRTNSISQSRPMREPIHTIFRLEKGIQNTARILTDSEGVPGAVRVAMSD